MPESKSSLLRMLSLCVLFFGFCIYYFVVLINLQIAGQDYYTMSSAAALTTRTVKIPAQRGEIFDRNGVPLVTNRYAYSVLLDADTFPADNGERNALLLQLTDSGSAFFSRPDSPFRCTVSDGELYFTYHQEYLDTTYGKRYLKLMKELVNNREITATNAAFRLMARYGICQDDFETMNYPAEQALLLLDLRLDMETHDFSRTAPYSLLTNCDLPFLSALKESVHRGYTVQVSATRQYNSPGLASHILGRVTKIPASLLEYYTEKGYAMDAMVGTSGAEYAFEDYLRGIDGELLLTEDRWGNLVDVSVKKEPVAGSDVYLTIDADYQKVAEQALADNIAYIVQKALEGGEPLTGEDADAGAITMVDVKTGQVLATASYPTFNLATFSEDYESLSQDKTLPMLNRALYGQYPPGSTFKVGIAATALQEGVLTSSTLLTCDGTYRYYEDSGFAPNCWIHSAAYGWRKHGSINITTAIQVSCNCFFFEVGRQLGISTMNRYSKVFGFGQNTGIELGESTGIMAGPDYREANALEAWSPGDTCTAAIGQSDNLVTPLQLSVYLSTIINSGTRLKATLLKEVRSYDGTVLYAAVPTVKDAITIDSDNRNLILNAMKDVTENGSAARVFRNYPIAVGGKTGTAERLSTESAYATFAAFAPFDDPEIVVSCIIERGASGTDAGYAVRDLFDVYFSLGQYAPGASEEGS